MSRMQRVTGWIALICTWRRRSRDRWVHAAMSGKALQDLGIKILASRLGTPAARRTSRSGAGDRQRKWRCNCQDANEITTVIAEALGVRFGYDDCSVLWIGRNGQ